MKQKFKTHIQMGTELILMAAFYNGWGRGALPQAGLRGDGGKEELDPPPAPLPPASPQGEFHGDPRF